MEFDLSSEVVVITGASRGLGAGMAEWFADRGARLGLCARRTPAIPAGGEGRAVAESIYVNDAEAMSMFADQVVGSLGVPTLWINNAGVLDPIAKVRDLSLDDLIGSLEVNVGGVLNGTQAYLRVLEAGGVRGSLVNISSGASSAGRAGWAAYCAGKAAVDRITETVALEESDRLGMVLAVAPGLVDTDMQALIRSQSVDVQPDVEWFKERHRAGDMNPPAWVAETIAKWHLGEGTPETVVCSVPRQPRLGA